MWKPTLGKRLGTGKEAEVFEFGDMVVKLYQADAPKRSAFREAANLALVEAFGLPVPSVSGVRQVGDRWGLVMARADGPSFADALKLQPELLPKYLQRMALLQLRVHSHPGTWFPSLKTQLAANISQAKMLGETRQRSLLNGLAALPDGDRLCHYDFHPLNILGPLGREVLIDWPNASQGDPAADICRSYVLIRAFAPDMASAYVDAHVAVSSDSRAKILGWLPFVAAARLTEGVPNEVDALMEMAASGQSL